jgi:hypothetical protein
MARRGGGLAARGGRPGWAPAATLSVGPPPHRVATSNRALQPGHTEGIAMTKLVRALAAVACAGLLVAATSAQAAADAKQVTITGKLACAMCILKQKDVQTCTNVVVAKEGAKEVVYGLTDNDVAKAYTMAACESTVPVKVTGTVAEAKGKKTITASKIEKS